MYDYYEAQKNCPCGSFAYVIKSGDTLYKLAITYNTTVEAIMEINPGLSPNNLKVGQRICIPKSTPCPTKCPMGTFAYTIKSGDTLYKLAIKYNTTVEAIMKVNPGIEPNNLQIGEVICIPESKPVPPTCPMGTFAYVIKSGDTIYNLAIKYNTTVEAIMKANPGIDPQNLQIGEVICIPESKPVPPTCPMGTFAYVIKSGDTIYNLAMQYNTTVEAIMAANPGLNPNNLQIGQVICIPKSTPVPPCDGIYYAVKYGDTLFGVAQMFNIPLAILIAANPGVDPNNLMVGQLLCIPKVTPPILCPGGTVYTVKYDDSLGTILLRFNLSVMDIQSSNPNIDIYNLREGQQLCIMPHMERGCPCGPGFESYTIVKSDIPMEGSVVLAIARKFNIPVESLMKANPNLTPSHFDLGQMICVPY